MDCIGAESYVFHAKVSDYVFSKQGKVVPKIKGHPENSAKMIAVCRRKALFLRS
jgi:hypothetical protein